MTEPARARATYDDLYAIPEHAKGEIIAGELRVTPRPSRRHVRTATVMGYFLGPTYDRGAGGPGGWIFLDEPEVSFGEDILVPDLAGWHQERFPVEEGTTGLP
ncbi:MAG: hypothetical protein AB1634_15180 [Thermodesulfobacteriota bacterium]